MNTSASHSGIGAVSDVGTVESFASGVSQKVNIRNSWLEIVHRERYFLMLIAAGFFLTGATYDIPSIAMWVGFAFAGYAAVSNDSIQTIGTFIGSNRDVAWYKLWAFIGGIFLVTVFAGWMLYDGDVSWGRLTSKGFAEAPTSFTFLQIAAPLFLIIITRLRMPVSTAFLLLSCFAANGNAIGKVMSKSVGGYFIAFACAMALWLTLGRWMQSKFTGTAHPAWRAFQWTTTGTLWSVWIMQDAANIAVFLPRGLNFFELCGFAGVVFFGLGALFRLGGDKIQEVVDEKSDVVDVRAASVIDMLYAAIMIYHLIDSSVPMSTTWVFLGLLGGRELAMNLAKATTTERSLGSVCYLMGRDVFFAGMGLLISVLLASAANPAIREAVLAATGLG